MPNWCGNYLIFSSTKHEPIEKLCNAITSFCKANKHRGVVEFFESQGYPKGKQINTDYRDYISWASGDMVTKENDKYLFSIDIESAWSPHIDHWFFYIHNAFGGDVNLKYFSEEISSEIFETNDLNGEFFKTRYKLNYYGYDNGSTEYFDSSNELLKYLIATHGVIIPNDATTKAMEQIVNYRLQKEFENAHIVITDVELVSYYDEQYLEEVPF